MSSSGGGLFGRPETRKGFGAFLIFGAFFIFCIRALAFRRKSLDKISWADFVVPNQTVAFGPINSRSR
jgi:hypothetical protein